MSTGRCPSELELDAFVVAGRPAGDALQAHLGDCARCQARLAARDRSREHFLREVYPATVAAVEAAGGPARPAAGWIAWLLRPAALGVAAGLVLVLLGGWLWWWAAGPGVGSGDGPGGAMPDTYLGVKGGASLQVYARRGDQVFQVRPGERLHRGDVLRFAPLLPGPGFVMILSVDAAGRVSLFFPQSGRRAAALKPPLGMAALPGAIELDDSRGPERLWLLFSNQEFELDLVEVAVAEGLRAAGSLEALAVLPGELEQASLLVWKE